MFYTDGQIQTSANWFYRDSVKGIAVVIGSYDGKLYCLDLASGKKIWEFVSTNYVNGSPAIANGKVVFGGCDALIHIYIVYAFFPLFRIAASGSLQIAHRLVRFLLLGSLSTLPLWSIPSMALFRYGPEES